MTDGFLRFNSRAEAEAAFATLGVDLAAGTMFDVGGQRLDVDVLFGDGIITALTGEAPNEFGMMLPVYSPVAGVHVNVRYAGEELPAALIPYHLTPATPKCVWG